MYNGITGIAELACVTNALFTDTVGITATILVLTSLQF
jgi:hypothetical protein